MQATSIRDVSNIRTAADAIDTLFGDATHVIPSISTLAGHFMELLICNMDPVSVPTHVVVADTSGDTTAGGGSSDDSTEEDLSDAESESGMTKKQPTNDVSSSVVSNPPSIAEAHRVEDKNSSLSSTISPAAVEFMFDFFAHGSVVTAVRGKQRKKKSSKKHDGETEPEEPPKTKTPKTKA